MAMYRQLTRKRNNNKLGQGLASFTYEAPYMQTYSNLSKDYFDAHADLMEVVADSLRDIGLREPEEIECRSRDGFSAASHNCGGLEAIGFVDIATLWGTGYTSNNDKANAAIEHAIEYNLELAKESFEQDYAEEIRDLNRDKINYHDLCDMDKGDLAEKLSNYESEMMNEDSIMLSVRFMYHGNNTASSEFGINWEAPYFRWKKGYCVSECVNLEWTDLADLKKQLTEANQQALAMFGALVRETF
jgi:hypothetical protein